MRIPNATAMTVLGVVLALAVPVSAAPAEPPLPPGWTATLNHPRPELLRYYRRQAQKLADRTGGLDPEDRKVRVRIATLRHADGKTEIDLLYGWGGEYACGTAGCELDIVLTRDGGRHYRQVGSVSAELPITVLPTTHHGLPDLVVGRHAGVGTDPTALLLVFNGRRYPDDSPVVDARPLYGNQPGREVMPEAPYGQGFRVYR